MNRPQNLLCGCRWVWNGYYYKKVLCEAHSSHEKNEPHNEPEDSKALQESPPEQDPSPMGPEDPEDVEDDSAQSKGKLPSAVERYLDGLVSEESDK